LPSDVAGIRPIGFQLDASVLDRVFLLGAAYDAVRPRFNINLQHNAQFSVGSDSRGCHGMFLLTLVRVEPSSEVKLKLIVSRDIFAKPRN